MFIFFRRKVGESISTPFRSFGGVFSKSPRSSKTKVICSFLVEGSVAFDSCLYSTGLSASDSAYKLVFDETKLDEVLTKNTMAEIKSVFTNSSDTGAMDRFKLRIDNTLAPTTGYFDSKESSFTSMISTQQNRIDRANDQLVLYEEVLLRQFQAMDQAIADMNSQYSSFVDSIAQLSG